MNQLRLPAGCHDRRVGVGAAEDRAVRCGAGIEAIKVVTAKAVPWSIDWTAINIRPFRALR